MQLALSGLFVVAVLAALIAVIIFAALYFRRVVPTNMVHIIQRKSSTVNYGRGQPGGNTYYAWPSWMPLIGISVTQFPESIFQVSLQNYVAYDKARVPFVVDVTAFFRISDASQAAQRVGSFDQLNTDLQAVLQGAVRRLLATNDLEFIMESRSELGDQFTQEVSSQTEEWGVSTAKSIEFMDLRDTDRGQVIANIMAKEESRISMESRSTVADNQRKAELAEIDAAREVEEQRQQAAQLIGIRTAQKELEVGVANEEAKQRIAESAKETMERDMNVREVEEVRSAQIKRGVAEVKAEEDKRVLVINAEAAKEAEIVSATADKEAMEQRAQGELITAQKDAEGISARGLAQAEAEKAMLQAPVDTQIALAKEIGTNEGYQHYLIAIEQIKASQTVGSEMAKAMSAAELKVIANASDINGGLSNLGDMFSPAGGTSLTGMLSALSQGEEGAALLQGLTSRLSGQAKALSSPKPKDDYPNASPGVDA